MSRKDKIGVALMNLDSPQSHTEVQAFLKRLFSDRAILNLPTWIRLPLAARIAKKRAPAVQTHYLRLGGQSPLSAQTCLQVESLQKALGDRYVVRHVFRYSPPFAHEVMEQFQNENIRFLVALPAYPQYSHSTTGSAIAEVARFAAKHSIHLEAISSYPTEAGYIDALLEPLLEDLLAPSKNGLRSWTALGHVLFAAHGLPKRMIDHGDPYLAQVLQTSSSLSERLPAGVPYSLAFQSRVGPVQWIKPYLHDEILRLAEERVQRLFLVPLSFVAENIETRYELDLEILPLARSLGIPNVHRTPCPGTHPKLIEAWARLVQAQVKEAGWEVRNAS